MMARTYKAMVQIQCTEATKSSLNLLMKGIQVSSTDFLLYTEKPFFTSSQSWSWHNYQRGSFKFTQTALKFQKWPTPRTSVLGDSEAPDFGVNNSSSAGLPGISDCKQPDLPLEGRTATCTPASVELHPPHIEHLCHVSFHFFLCFRGKMAHPFKTTEPKYATECMIPPPQSCGSPAQKNSMSSLCIMFTLNRIADNKYACC